MIIAIMSATTTNKPGYTGPIDGSTMPRYDQFLAQRKYSRTKHTDDEEDTDTHSSLEAAASDWHGSVIEDTDEC